MQLYHYTGGVTGMRRHERVKAMPRSLAVLPLSPL
jgi:hypothetical protein